MWNVQNWYYDCKTFFVATWHRSCHPWFIGHRRKTWLSYHIHVFPKMMLDLLQQREFKQFIDFQLLSTWPIFSFQSLEWNSPGNFQPTVSYRSMSKARRRARSVASLHGASCSAAAARPRQSAGRLTSFDERRRVTTGPVTCDRCVFFCFFGCLDFLVICVFQDACILKVNWMAFIITIKQKGGMRSIWIMKMMGWPWLMTPEPQHVSETNLFLCMQLLTVE